MRIHGIDLLCNPITTKHDTPTLLATIFSFYSTPYKDRSRKLCPNNQIKTHYLLPLVEVANTFDTAATRSDIFSARANKDVSVCARSLHNHSLAAVGTPFLDHFTTLQRQEPGIRPDIVHRSTRFGIDIQHPSDERSALRWLKSIEELHWALVDGGRRRWGVISS